MRIYELKHPVVLLGKSFPAGERVVFGADEPLPEHLVGKVKQILPDTDTDKSDDSDNRHKVKFDGD